MITSRLVRDTLRCGFWLGGFLFLSGMAVAEDHPALQPVKELFAAMSKQDGQAMHDQATEDFQLLEHGEVWTMQKLVEAVQPKGDPYERKNFFKQIQARQEGNVAWLSYWNKAEIRRKSGMRTVVWLESAVMVKEGDRWKIQLLHSTRLESDKHPRILNGFRWKLHPSLACCARKACLASVQSKLVSEIGPHSQYLIGQLGFVHRAGQDHGSHQKRPGSDRSAPSLPLIAGFHGTDQKLDA